MDGSLTTVGRTPAEDPPSVVASRNALLEAIHQDAAAVASALLRKGERHVSLHTHDLLGEAVVRLLNSQDTKVQDRAHLMALVARTMRRVLIDAARARQADKRAGQVITLATRHGDSSGDRVDLIKLDHALKRLKVLDPDRACLVELRFFGGLSLEETAEALGCSISTVQRSWRTAKVWLRHTLQEIEDADRE